MENATSYFRRYVELNLSKEETYYFFKTEQLAFLSILFVFIICGNIIVIVTIFSQKNKSRMKFFIIQLAITDILVGLISVLTEIIWKITIEFEAGNVGCKTIRYLQGVVTFSSNYVLVALSIDRYDAIANPMGFTKSWKRARYMVATAWILSFVFSSPLLYLYQEEIISGTVQCWIDMDPWQWKLYVTVITVAIFFIPMIIITIAYVIIVYEIWTKCEYLQCSEPHKIKDESITAHCSSETSTSTCRRRSSKGVIPKAKIKSIKMTFLIVFVFTLCWSPYIIFALMQVYSLIPKTQVNNAIATFIQSSVHLNSAANPFIYCIFSKKVCSLRLCCKQFRRCRERR